MKVKGKFVHDKEILIGPRALIGEQDGMRPGSLFSDPKKNQGWLVVTPFMLADTGYVVERFSFFFFSFKINHVIPEIAKMHGGS